MSKTTKTTTAHRIAAVLHDDGQTWETEDGRDLDALCREESAWVEPGQDDQHGNTRYEFPDGSAIVATEGGWDIEGSTPWSWESAE